MDSLGEGARTLLEQTATGVPLPRILEGIVRLVEGQSPGMTCSILLLDDDGVTLRHGAAPGLPGDYVAAIDGAKIGPSAGSCGAAAYLREPVIVSDLGLHPNWADYRHLVLPHGLRACWSTPVLDADGAVVGTFAMYHREPHEPSGPEREWVGVATHLAAIAIARDRSERERHRLLESLQEQVAALRRSEARLAAVIEHSPNVGVQGYDDRGRVLFANAASYRLFGWQGRDPVGKTLGEMNFPAEEAERFMRAIDDVRRAGGPAGPLEFRYERPDGSLGVLMSTVFQIPYGADDACYVCMDVDLTEHRRAEEQARAGDQLRSLIYSVVSDVIFYLAVEPGPRYRFLSVNPAFSEATGLPASAVVGRFVDEVIPEPSRSLVLERYAGAIAQRRAVSWTETSEYPTGTKYGEVTVAPVFDARGACTNLVGTVHDLTARVRAEEERRRLEEHLYQAQRLHALGTITGGIAHDFNNLLVAILAHAELALLDPRRSDLESHLTAIRKAGRRGSDLVRRLLRFSRREPPRRERLRVATVVDEVFELLRATAPRVVLRRRVSPDVPEIDVDPTQVHQVVLNLCTNAVHAMNGGGEIDVFTERVVLPDDLPDLPRGEYLRLSVADTGCGMDAATLQRIFEPFFTTKPAGEGTGLGLSVVHGIMKAHGGGVRVESEPGRGTTFHLYFPTAQETSAPAPSPPRGEGRGQHVFYIDDDEDLLTLTSRVLRRLGYRVTTFHRAPDMLAALHDPSVEVDAVVSDVSMPGINGPRLLEAVKAIRPTLRAILVSGYVRPEDIEDASRRGLPGVVPKPSTVDEFARLLHALLPRPDAEAR